MNWLSEASRKVSAMMYIPPEDEAPANEKEEKTGDGNKEEAPIPTVNIPPSVSDFFNKAKENSTVWGKSFASYAKKAAQTAAESASQLKDIVQEQTKQSFLGEFDREQTDFTKHLEDEDKKSSVCGMPWDDVPESAIAKKQILALSLDSRNFLRAPPSDTKFDLEKYRKTAAELLQNDPNLNKIRYLLVPKELTEEEFWTNYFYRCSLIRKSLLGEGSGSEEAESDRPSDENPEDPSTEAKTSDSEENQKRGDSPAQDSDESDRSEKIRALKEKMDEIKSEDADWEEELANEIAEFELVKEDTGKDENWEKEIEAMINEELGEGK
uniref:BSD domain-containing protein n=1 Tax=Steinernema glaseri TaxID=37863 RepID=A0A1I7ZVM4_9BILA